MPSTGWQAASGTTIPRWRAASGTLMILLALPAAGWAQELALLRKIPAELLRYTGGARSDEDGMVGHNRGGFKSPEFQGAAMQYMIRGAIVAGNKTWCRRRLAGD